MSHPKCPSIYKYLDFKKYLSDCYQALKKENSKAFTQRAIAIKAGYRSPSFFNEIIQAKKKLTPRGVNGLARVFSLNNKERAYLRLLVQLNQGSPEEQSDAWHSLLKNYYFRKINKIENIKAFEILGEWYTLAIRHLKEFPDYQENPKWIAEKLAFDVSPKEIKKAITLLKENNLYHIEDVDFGKMISEKAKVYYVLKYYKQMLEFAERSSVMFHKDFRFKDSMVITLSFEDFQYYKEELSKFNYEISQKLEDKKNKNKEKYKRDAVFTILLYMFPLTKTPKSNKT